MEAGAERWRWWSVVGFAGGRCGREEFGDRALLIEIGSYAIDIP